MVNREYWNYHNLREWLKTRKPIPAERVIRALKALGINLLEYQKNIIIQLMQERPKPGRGG
jgi:hypothetical protein